MDIKGETNSACHPKINSNIAKACASKINYFLKNDKIRIDYAKSAYKKYHKYMNNKIIANYILNCSDIIKTVNPYWHNII